MGPAGQREPWLLSCCLSSGASLPYFLGALWAPRLTGTAASTWPHSPSALGPPTASRGCPLPPTGPRLVHPFRCLEAERPWQCLEPSQPSERGQGLQCGDPRATGVALRLTPPPGPRGCSRVQGCLAFWKLSLGLLGRDPAQTEGDKPSFCRLEPEGREPPLENAEGPAEERLLARPVLPAPHVRGGQKHQSTSLQLGIAGHSWHWALACTVPTFSLLLSSEGRSEGLVGWCVRLRPLGDEQSWESLPGRAAAQAQHGGAGPLHRGAPWFPSNANRAALLLQGSVASGVREARKDLTGGGSTRGHGQLPKCGRMVGTWTRILPLFQAVNTSGAALFGDHRLPHGAPHTVPGSSRLMVASGCGLAERVAL